MEKNTNEKKAEMEKKTLFELVQKMRLEEFIIDLVCHHVESHLKLPEFESIEHFLKYQEAYHEGDITKLKNIFMKKLDLLFTVMKEDIVNNFVNH